MQGIIYARFPKRGHWGTSQSYGKPRPPPLHAIFFTGGLDSKAKFFLELKNISKGN